MYRLGYLDLIQYKDIFVFPVFLLLISVLTVMCSIYIRTSFNSIVRDYSDGKLDGLDIRSSKLKKLCNVFISIIGDANTYFMYNYMCYINAIIRLKNGKEDLFFAELENCKKKNTFALRSSILALYHLSKKDTEKAIKYYREYIVCENKSKEMNAVMGYMFENKGISDEEQTYKEYLNGIQNSVIQEILSSIERPLQVGEDVSKVIENTKSQKKKNKWIFIFILLLVICFQFCDLPWKSILTTYSSPEEAYASIYPNNELQLKLEGNDSCLLIGSNLYQHDHLMVSEKNGMWKVERDSDVKVKEGHLNTIFYYYYQYDETDSYLVIRALEGVECEMFDSCDSEFTLINSEKVIVGRMYCATIENYDESYWVNINGTQIKP